jgi:hypothetical protein
MAFADVKYACLQMLDGLVSTHPTFVKQTFEFIEGSIEMLSKHYCLSENVIKKLAYLSFFPLAIFVISLPLFYINMS